MKYIVRLRFSIIVVLSLFLLLQPLPAWLSLPPLFHDHGGSAEAAEEKQLYTCSMHPFIIRDMPGNCPICGMTLVPVRATTGRKEDENTAGSIITIEPETQQKMGVRFAIVKKTDLARIIRTVGLVGYDEQSQYSVNAKIDGWVDRLHVNQTGESVRKGQPLLDIYSPDLVTAQQEFLLAVHNHEVLKVSPYPEIARGADDLLLASRKRLQYWDISDEQIEVLARTGEIKKTLTLYAAKSGVVTRKNVTDGAFIKSGAELYQLSDISRVWIFADIYEYELPWVKEGQKAMIQFPYSRSPVNGVVSMIYPYVEPKSRTIKARIDVENTDLALKPDMYVNVQIEGQFVRNALTVPTEAVLRTGVQETVFAAIGEGRFEARRVRTGLESNEGEIQILEGLHEGERIVTSAQFMFDSESSLREAIKKLTPEVPESSPTPAGQEVPAREKELEGLFK